jgi:hypothetical protein
MDKTLGQTLGVIFYQFSFDVAEKEEVQWWQIW